jgi:hypothetical protein
MAGSGEGHQADGWHRGVPHRHHLPSLIPPLRPWLRALAGHWRGWGPESDPEGPRPAGLGDALRQELGRAFHPPYEAPFLFPLGTQDMLFTLHGELAFPMVLASWMFSDVPATNDPVLSGQMLGAKNLALWLLVAPACAAAVAVVLAASASRGRTTRCPCATGRTIAGRSGSCSCVEGSSRWPPTAPSRCSRPCWWRSTSPRSWPSSVTGCGCTWPWVGPVDSATASAIPIAAEGRTRRLQPDDQPRERFDAAGRRAR